MLCLLILFGSFLLSGLRLLLREDEQQQQQQQQQGRAAAAAAWLGALEQPWPAVAAAAAAAEHDRQEGAAAPPPPAGNEPLPPDPIVPAIVPAAPVVAAAQRDVFDFEDISLMELLGFEGPLAQFGSRWLNAFGYNVMFLAVFVLSPLAVGRVLIMLLSPVWTLFLSFLSSSSSSFLSLLPLGTRIGIGSTAEGEAADMGRTIASLLSHGTQDVLAAVMPLSSSLNEEAPAASSLPASRYSIVLLFLVFRLFT